MISVTEAMKVLDAMREKLVQQEANYTHKGGSPGMAAQNLGWIRDRHESLTLAIGAMRALHGLPK